jgi:hypothetical protein
MIPLAEEYMAFWQPESAISSTSGNLALSQPQFGISMATKMRFFNGPGTLYPRLREYLRALIPHFGGLKMRFLAVH